jgi:mRNA-degrading endonuclease RelE of RelBE toxin-antitoxin system
MNVLYRKLFLKDLKKLQRHSVSEEIFEIAFTILPQAESLHEIRNVKAMINYPKRYRIRIGDYRIGIEVQGDTVEMMRVLHRKEFYRYFP